MYIILTTDKFVNYMKKTPLKRYTPLKRQNGTLRRTSFLNKKYLGLASKLTGVKRISSHVVRVWSTPYADSQFSHFIRDRDGKCLKCGTTNDLTCSHLWNRNRSSTRFDPKNCITLCKYCHFLWETKKNDEYREFMIVWLGSMAEYIALEVRARTFKSRYDAVYDCMKMLESVV